MLAYCTKAQFKKSTVNFFGIKFHCVPSLITNIIAVLQ